MNITGCTTDTNKRRQEVMLHVYRRRNPPKDCFQFRPPAGRRISDSFPSYPKLLSARWKMAHSLSNMLASSKALGRACGASIEPGAMSPEKSSSSSPRISSASSVDEESKRAWNLLFNRTRHGSTSDDAADSESRSAISNCKN